MGQGLDGIIEEIDRYKLQKKKETWKVWYRLGLADMFQLGLYSVLAICLRQQRKDDCCRIYWLLLRGYS
jgi:hypothetical protein